MRGFRKLTLVNLKLYLREPIATFFTLAFPPLLVVLFGAMYGNDPLPMFGGYGSMDVSMPAYTAMILGTVGFLGVPITISGYRESGVLRRFQATPMRPLTYILADIVANLVTTLLGMMGLVIIGWLLYRVQFEGQVMAVILAVVFCGLAMFSIGYLIAGLAPGARTAQVVGMVIFYPMMFLSGASIPLEVMPETIQRIADFLPLTYVVRLLRG
ncbi:MAG: ABC transporter permease, partial [Anaerolineae bacterium]|nr:ABC transporter permease [Anaerolineae bacterium]